MTEEEKTSFLKHALRRKPLAIRYLTKRCHENQLPYIDDMYQDVLMVALKRKMSKPDRELDLCLFSAYTYVLRTGIYKDLPDEPCDDEIIYDFDMVFSSDIGPDLILMNRDIVKNRFLSICCALFSCKHRNAIIYLRRLRGDTLQSIGDDYGLTRERTRQIEDKISGLVEESARQMLNPELGHNNRLDVLECGDVVYLDMISSDDRRNLSFLISYYNSCVSNFASSKPKGYADSKINKRIDCMSQAICVPDTSSVLYVDKQGDSGLLSIEFCFRYDTLSVLNQQSDGTWVSDPDFNSGEDLYYQDFESMIFGELYDSMSESMSHEEYVSSMSYVDEKLKAILDTVC